MDTRPCASCTESIPKTATRCPKCHARQPETMHRGHPTKLIAGVCTALARYLDIHPVLVRVAFVAATLMTGGLVLSVYIAFWLLTPPTEHGVAPAFRFMDWLSDLFSPNGHPRHDP